MVGEKGGEPEMLFTIHVSQEIRDIMAQKIVFIQFRSKSVHGTCRLQFLFLSLLLSLLLFLILIISLSSNFKPLFMWILVIFMNFVKKSINAFD